MSEMQYDSSDQQPEPTDSEFTMLTQDLEIEHTGISERLHHFDIARHELYSFTEEVMRGAGGESLEESSKFLNNLTAQAATTFAAASLILSQEIEDKDAAIKTIVDLHIRDELERVSKFRDLNQEVNFTYSETSHLIEFLQSISSSEEALEQAGVVDLENPLPELSTYGYRQALEFDLQACLTGALPNAHEEAELKRLHRNDMIKETMLGIGKTAAAAAIALWVNDRLRRR